MTTTPGMHGKNGDLLEDGQHVKWKVVSYSKPGGRDWIKGRLVGASPSRPQRAVVEQGERLITVPFDQLEVYPHEG